MDLHRDDEEGDRKEGEGIGVDAAAAIGRQLDTHGTMLEQILAILQAEPEGAGLGELLAALVAAIGEQGRYLKEISAPSPSWPGTCRSIWWRRSTTTSISHDGTGRTAADHCRHDDISQNLSGLEWPCGGELHDRGQVRSRD